MYNKESGFRMMIGGDLVPTTSNAQYFMEKSVNDLLGKSLMELLDSASYKVFNLETPLTDLVTPIKKCGPCLIAPSATVSGIKAIGADLLTVANNHILDQGEQGFLSTLELLNSAGIKHVGGGSSEEASLPVYAEIAGVRVGFYACAEHEFSIASEESLGANPFDPLISLDHISSMRDKCDYIVCLYHGGKEYYRYPSPNLQRNCRRMVDKGADLVICQHSHCIGCEEKYQNGTILYGQGNFLFDYLNHECWQTSLLIEIAHENNGEFNISYHPLCKDGKAVRLADEEEAASIMNDFYRRSEQIKEKGFIQESYTAFAKQSIDKYVASMNWISRTFVYRALNRILHGKMDHLVYRLTISKCRYIMMNFIECEAHRELMLEGLREN